VGHVVASQDAATASALEPVRSEMTTEIAPRQVQARSPGRRPEFGDYEVRGDARARRAFVLAEAPRPTTAWLLVSGRRSPRQRCRRRQRGRFGLGAATISDCAGVSPSWRSTRSGSGPGGRCLHLCAKAFLHYAPGPWNRRRPGTANSEICSARASLCRLTRGRSPDGALTGADCRAFANLEVRPAQGGDARLERIVGQGVDVASALPPVRTCARCAGSGSLHVRSGGCVRRVLLPWRGWP
jgi:hypothetical protein